MTCLLADFINTRDVRASMHNVHYGSVVWEQAGLGMRGGAAWTTGPQNCSRTVTASPQHRWNRWTTTDSSNSENVITILCYFNGLAHALLSLNNLQHSPCNITKQKLLGFLSFVTHLVFLLTFGLTNPIFFHISRRRELCMLSLPNNVSARM